jgi:serine/threonine protein kinase
MEQSTWIGRSLNGRYRIDALLGQGGMSAVYKATDPNLKRVVAIKLIHPHLSIDSDFIYRFKKEAAAVAALRHQNIIQVFDFNTDNDVNYMVLEFVPGETLQDRLKHLKQSNTKMPIDQAIRIILNVCDALSYAHKLGMIHRDIKPANIMLDLHGQAILMDFGIVKILDDTSHTATGAVVGTARYMSPEVIRSEMPDERSDLYSLGVTFYEMLSGDPPFDAPSAMSLLMRHLNDPVPDLKTKRQDLPPELIRIVNRSLEKDRDNRYGSASEMAGDLRRVLAALEAGSAPTASPTPKADPALIETKKSASQAEDQTEPWDVPAQAPAKDDSIFDKPTTVDHPVRPVEAEKTVREPVKVPRQETSKAETKTELKPAVGRQAASLSPLIKFGGLGALALALIIGFFAVRGAFLPAPEPTATATSTFTQPAPAATATQPPSTDAPASTPTLEPTATIALTPTPSTPYVVITGILLENDKYVVNYEVHNFPESPSLHVHMFFNTVPPEQAGMPGSGPWKLTWGAYGDPPFTEYGPANRPASATQMCSLVANPNHSVQLGSGNCFDLP